MHVEDLVGGEQCIGQPFNIGYFSVSPAGNNEVFGRIQLAVNANLSRIFKSSVAFEDLDAVFLQQPLHTQSDFFTTAVFVLKNLFKVDFFNCCLYAKRFTRSNAPNRFNRFQPCFGGNASPVDADSTQLACFHQGDPSAQLGSSNGGGITTGSSSDNDDIVHVYPPV